jgi:hypothetical protein
MEPTKVSFKVTNEGEFGRKLEIRHKISRLYRISSFLPNSPSFVTLKDTFVGSMTTYLSTYFVPPFPKSACRPQMIKSKGMLQCPLLRRGCYKRWHKISRLYRISSFLPNSPSFVTLKDTFVGSMTPTKVSFKVTNEGEFGRKLEIR